MGSMNQVEPERELAKFARLLTEITKLREENRLLHGFVECMGYEMTALDEHGVIFQEKSAWAA